MYCRSPWNYERLVWSGTKQTTTRPFTQFILLLLLSRTEDDGEYFLQGVGLFLLISYGSLDHDLDNDPQEI